MEDDYILKLVFEELKQAQKLHPKWPDDIVYKGAIIAEEAGEVVKAINDYYFHNRATSSEIIEEVIQTIVVCIRFLQKM